MDNTVMFNLKGEPKSNISEIRSHISTTAPTMQIAELYRGLLEYRDIYSSLFLQPSIEAHTVENRYRTYRHVDSFTGIVVG